MLLSHKMLEVLRYLHPNFCQLKGSLKKRGKIQIMKNMEGIVVTEEVKVEVRIEATKEESHIIIITTREILVNIIARK